jgi:pilus assembly protein CpaF
MDHDSIFRATLGKFLEPIAQYLNDDKVSEVMINGPDEVYIERYGIIERTDTVFDDEEKLLAAARNIAQYTNKRITPLTARFDSRLPDGSRVHVVMPRCSNNGLCISIRKFRRSSFTLDDLVKLGSLTPEAKEYIETVVALKCTILVSGGTGSGKTSLLNSISSKISSSDRIIVIEDSSELQLQQPHVLSFESAWPDRHGQGAVTLRDLLHSSLRMRPDRIIVGEVRGGEALDMLQAMNTGHGGSMSTLHANSALDALHRLETLALMSGVEIPLAALRPQVASAINVVIQVSRLNSGQRVVTEICEVNRLSEDNKYIVNQIFERKKRASKKSGPPSLALLWTRKQSIFGHLVSQQGLSDSVKLTRKIFL